MKKVAFLWDNFGPLHVDRCEAFAAAKPDMKVLGVELSAKSAVYDWHNPDAVGFTKFTLSQTPGAPQIVVLARLCWWLLRWRPHAIFLCHYYRPAIFFSAVLCRLIGIKTFITSDSKFDDYPRRLSREFGKMLMYAPYQGALVASPRSADYLRFLGVPTKRIELGNYALSHSRLHAAIGPEPVFEERPYIAIARLVPKKNLQVIIRAFAALPAEQKKRGLVICGSGPLEQRLRDLADTEGVSSCVTFTGFVQSAEISRLLSSSLVLLLPSIEEQFGQVVEEAQVLRIPVIITPQVGAADEFVQSGMTGFLCEPHNVEGYSVLMALLGTDEHRWEYMRRKISENDSLSNLERFVNSAQRLIDAL